MRGLFLIKYSTLLIPSFVEVLWHRRELIRRLAQRDILSRYRGSLLGWAWTFINPLAMLAIYTFVFSQVFKAKWSSATGVDQGPLFFAINLFVGLIVFNQFSECFIKAPGIILSNPNFAKKVVFPLEILPIVTVLSAFVHTLSSLIILMIFQLISKGGLQLEYAWLILVWLPMLLLCLSVTWLFSIVGVYFRDFSQISGVITSALLFLSPVFFPLSALPLRFQPILALNPIAIMIEQTRRVTILGDHPSILYLIMSILLSIITAELSFKIFMRIKPSFADML